MQPPGNRINPNENITDRRLSPNYEIKSKTDIENMEKMAEAIERIHTAIDTQLFDHIVDWQNDTLFSIRRLKEKANISYFIVKDDELVGYATMREARTPEMPEPESKGYYLSFIAIDPKKQRSGMGKALMKTIRQRAKLMQAEYLVLDYRGTEKLTNFYESLKRGTHTSTGQRTNMNPETGQLETHPNIRAVYQLKKPN